MAVSSLTYTQYFDMLSIIVGYFLPRFCLIALEKSNCSGVTCAYSNACCSYTAGYIQLGLLYQVAYVWNGNTAIKKATQPITWKNCSGKKEKYDLLRTAEYHSLAIS